MATYTADLTDAEAIVDSLYTMYDDAKNGNSTIRENKKLDWLEANGLLYLLREAVTANATSDVTSYLAALNEFADKAGVSEAGAITPVTVVSDSDLLVAANDLSDVDDAATARTNLGLGSLAEQSNVNNDDWSGTDLAITNGGTGTSSAAAAIAALGGLPVAGGTMTGSILGDQIGRFRVQVNETDLDASLNLDTLTKNTLNIIDTTSSGGFTITITDDANSSSNIGDSFYFFHKVAAGSVTITDGGSQTSYGLSSFPSSIGFYAMTKIAENEWAVY